ncbi:hypothetical protein GWI72_12075 [Microvirga tunisiensis]|uniref:Uncharacterized protein n=2 Tax=Pannonibacter tanglangensis TaxID=2750084 RepID=A0ABW9ZHY0_9HYPH|nr:hypothetical protein [Pannonibacter sp. XCT-34]NBN79006.1 hypothetical protein [Pannonibacter sp. XCT-53]
MAALAVALAGCVTDPNGYEEGVDQAAVRKIMEGLGAVDPKQKPIEYRPRAPLAMPSNLSALPQPEAPATETAANWPKPENQELQDLKALYARSNGTDLLTPEQMRGIQIGSTQPRDVARERRDEQIISGGLMTPAEMKQQHQGAGQIDTSKLFGPDGQPVRRFLVEPPVAYSTPAANAPLTKPADTNDVRRREIREMEGAQIKMNCTPTPTEDCIQR